MLFGSLEILVRLNGVLVNVASSGQDKNQPLRPCETHYCEELYYRFENAQVCVQEGRLYILRFSGSAAPSDKSSGPQTSLGISGRRECLRCPSFPCAYIIPLRTFLPNHQLNLDITSSALEKPRLHLHVASDR